MVTRVHILSSSIFNGGFFPSYGSPVRFVPGSWSEDTILNFSPPSEQFSGAYFEEAVFISESQPTTSPSTPVRSQPTNFGPLGYPDFVPTSVLRSDAFPKVYLTKEQKAKKEALRKRLAQEEKERKEAITTTTHPKFTEYIAARAQASRPWPVKLIQTQRPTPVRPAVYSSGIKSLDYERLTPRRPAFQNTAYMARCREVLNTPQVFGYSGMYTDHGMGGLRMSQPPVFLSHQPFASIQSLVAPSATPVTTATPVTATATPTTTGPVTAAPLFSASFAAFASASRPAPTLSAACRASTRNEPAAPLVAAPIPLAFTPSLFVLRPTAAQNTAAASSAAPPTTTPRPAATLSAACKVSNSRNEPAASLIPAHLVPNFNFNSM